MSRPTVRWIRAALAALACAALLAHHAHADCGPPPDSDAEILARPHVSSAIDEARRTMANAQGRLWRIETDPLSYLVGTVHVAGGGLEDPGPLVTSIVEDARVLFVEVGRDALEAEMRRIASDPSRMFRTDGAVLSDRLSTRQADAARALLRAHGLPFTLAERMHPAFLVAILAMPPCAAELASVPGLDERLERLAEAARVPVRPLETVEEQLAVLLGDLQMMEDQLVLLVEQADRILPAWFENHALYRAGLFGAVWTSAVAELRRSIGAAEAEEVARRIWTRWVAERNARMLERARPSLAEGGVVIAVGALHLPGGDGLVALLRDQGFVVERLDDAPL